MSVLVDTTVWSLALRRRRSTSASTREAVREGAIVSELTELVRDGRARLIGPVRQELLSGLRHEEQFLRLRDKLRAFPDEALVREDYEEAAAMGNRCRIAGIQGSTVDFLLCAVAARRRFALFTTDVDFVHYDRVLGLALYRPEKS
jgi:predicted nucleic acid-binding protein